MPAPLLVTSIEIRPQTLSVPGVAWPVDMVQLESGSAADPLAVARVTFDGQRTDRLGERERVVVIVPVLDLLHLRGLVDDAIAEAGRQGRLRLAEQDRRANQPRPQEHHL